MRLGALEIAVALLDIVLDVGDGRERSFASANDAHLSLKVRGEGGAPGFVALRVG